MNIGKAIGIVITSFILLVLWVFFWWQYSRADVAQLKGTTNTEDARIDGSPPPEANYNYGGGTWIGADGDASIVFLFRPVNVASELGENATITACVCSLYLTTGAPENTISAYRCYKSDWQEGTKDAADPGAETSCTWNDWQSDAKEWGTAGCESADDGGSENTGDGTGADRKATAEDATAVGATGAWYSWTISNALAQEWYAGTATGGLVFINAGSTEKRFYSSEYANADYHPRFYITYTTNGVEEEYSGKFPRGIGRGVGR